MNHSSEDNDGHQEEVMYQRVASFGATTDIDPQTTKRRRSILINYISMSVLLSINHGTIVSCLAFATLQLGFAVGAWQSSVFHISYALSSLCGVSTIFVKKCGPKLSLIVGMLGYSVFVTCFYVLARQEQQHNTTTIRAVLAIVGAICGGTGGAFVWIGQGCYFKRAAYEYALQEDVAIQEEPTSNTGDNNDEHSSNNHTTTPNYHHAIALFSGVFAFIYLFLEVAAKLSSWVILQIHHHSSHWNTVLGFYTIAAVGSTLAMVVVKDYPHRREQNSESGRCLVGKASAAAWRLFWGDAKMKLLVTPCAAFGFATALVNAHVNGHVVRHVFVKDTNQHLVGLFSALTSAVGAVCSLMFSYTASTRSDHDASGRKSTTARGLVVLVIGAVAFGLTALPLLLYPHGVGYKLLVAIYSFQGIGRATFEGPLRATFAEYFADEEGAFANMTLHSGVFLALAFFFSFGIKCHGGSNYCVGDDRDHDIMTLELLVVISSILAVVGHWRASALYEKEQQQAITSPQAAVPSEDEVEALI